MSDRSMAGSPGGSVAATDDAPLAVPPSASTGPRTLTLPPSATISGIPTLTGIPLELRVMILGYLLHNPELEKATSIWPSGARQKYGLTPAILQACQQLYIEGHHVLYDHKFYFACLSDSAEHESPLTRYIHSIKGESLRDHPAIKYINRCIVVIGGERRSYNNSFSPRPLTDFCRSAHYMPLTGREALEVCVLLKGMAGDVKLEGISKLLAPLKLMRLQYGVLEIRDAKS